MVLSFPPEVSMPKPVVLAIQHIDVEPPGLVASAVEAAGGSVQTVRVFEGAPVPREIERYAGLVVMGGPMGVYDAANYPHVLDEARLIERALAAHLPILGICLGGQLLASVLGAEVYPGSRKEIGWFPVTLEPEARKDPVFSGLPPSFTPMHWHGDVFDLPAGATSLARSAQTRHQAFVFGDRAYGVLFHLEYTVPQVDEMARLFADELRSSDVPPEALKAGARAHGPAAEALGLGLYSRWMDLVTGSPADLPSGGSPPPRNS
jgi:GMP synthase (glutamine-hydrolysing)